MMNSAEQTETQYIVRVIRGFLKIVAERIQDRGGLHRGTQGFGRYLRATRLIRNIDHQTMEGLTGIDGAILLALEKGIYDPEEISLKWMEKLAEVLNEDVEIFSILLRATHESDGTGIALSDAQFIYDQDFPLLTDAYREVLRQALDETHVERALGEIQSTEEPYQLSYELLMSEIVKTEGSPILSQLTERLSEYQREGFSACEALVDLAEQAFDHDPSAFERLKRELTLIVRIINKKYKEDGGLVYYIITMLQRIKKHSYLTAF